MKLLIKTADINLPSVLLKDTCNPDNKSIKIDNRIAKKVKIVKVVKLIPNCCYSQRYAILDPIKYLGTKEIRPVGGKKIKEGKVTVDKEFTIQCRGILQGTTNCHGCKKFNKPSKCDDVENELE